MKILYIITKSEAGGAQTHVFQLSRYMAEKGSEVAVMAYPGGWLENELRIKNKELGIEFYPNKYFKNSYNPLLGLKAMKEVKKAVQDFQPDIVSCHSTVAGFWTRLALRRFVRQGKPFVIFTAHGWGFTQGVFWFRRKLLPLAEKIASRYCKKIICVSEYDRQLALKYKIAPKEKLVTIYNGVEIQSTTNYQLPTINNREPRIVFVGRLAEPKQPELLLEAFNELLDDVKKRAQVAIIGDGPKREKLEKIVKEKSLQNKVKLLGGLTREKVFEVLRKSDIFVLISNYEGFPRTILEAMSCGLPVVASNVGGISEILRLAQGKPVGYLIERGDIEGLKKALTELIENPELREEMGRGARERAEKEFSLEKMLEETEKIYQSLILF